MEKQRFYQKTWFVILSLVFLAPLGVFLMWRYKTWNKTSKIILSIVFLLFFIIAAASTAGDSEEPSQTPKEAISSSSDVSTSPENSSERTVDYEAIFTGYVEQDFKKVAVRKIEYKPQDGYITVDFNMTEGDYSIVSTQEEGEALALSSYSKIIDLFEHSKEIGLYPSGVEVTFNAYYLGENVFGFIFDAETIENTDWLTVTAEDFQNLWKDYYIK